MAERVVRIGDVEIGPGRPLALIAGPCVIESEEAALEVARAVSRTAEALGMPFVFKSSYLKDNRSSPGSYAGPGLEEGLRILGRVRRDVGVPVLSDVHERTEIGAAAEALDALQIPAFLCRQTRLVQAAARTGLPLNIKKGQFVSPENMAGIVAKAEAAGAAEILVTERGTCFGYSNLVVDMRAFQVMRALDRPLVFDVTHSLQLPGAAGGVSGGRPEFAGTLARAACAAGCDALFIETHPDPPSALSDARSMVPLSELRTLLEGALAVALAVREDAGRAHARA